MLLTAKELFLASNALQEHAAGDQQLAIEE